jgi:hypothetical protein
LAEEVPEARLETNSETTTTPKEETDVLDLRQIKIIIPRLMLATALIVAPIQAILDLHNITHLAITLTRHLRSVHTRRRLEAALIPHHTTVTLGNRTLQIIGETEMTDTQVEETETTTIITETEEIITATVTSGTTTTAPILTDPSVVEMITSSDTQ